jgi:hypothetical protein
MDRGKNTCTCETQIVYAKHGTTCYLLGNKTLDKANSFTYRGTNYMYMWNSKIMSGDQTTSIGGTKL